MMRPASSINNRHTFFDRLKPYALRVLESIMMLFIRVNFHGSLPESDSSKTTDKTQKIKPEQAKNHRCYVLSGKSLTERLLLARLTRQFSLPDSEQAISLTQEKSNAIALHRYSYGIRGARLLNGSPQPTVSPRLIRIMAHLIEQPEQDIQLIPVSIFWGRSPGQTQETRTLFNDQRGWLRQAFNRLVAIVFHGRHTLVHFSEPVSLQALIATSQKETSLNLHVRKTARLLRVHFRQTRRGVIGPELPNRKQLIRQLANSSRVKKAIQKSIELEQISTKKAQQKALKYADEIVANVSFNTQKFFDLLLSRLWNRLYDGVSVHNIEPVQEAAKHSTIIYVPCHRSHMDYLLLSYALFHNGLTIPHVAAGINLNIPFVGALLRRGGAFFLRRSFKDNPLYAAVFSEYLFHLLNKGHATEYFVEGGRSRTGRTLTPKPGMLSMTVQGLLLNPHRRIQLVPVYIGYEKVVEANTYLGELKGKEKKGESLLGLIHSLKTLKEHFGKVDLSFGQPISLSENLQQQIPNWQQIPQRTEQNTVQERPDWLPQYVEHLSQQVATGINNAATLNGANLTALGLLAANGHTLEVSSLKHFLQLCSQLHNDLSYEGSSPSCEKNPEKLIQEAEKLKLITRLKHPYGDLLQLNEKQSLLMTWYRNNILHLFALPSLIAFCFNQHPQQNRTQLYRHVEQLYPLLKKELFLPWPITELPQQFDRLLDWFLTKDLIIQQDNRLQINSQDQDKATLIKMLARPIQPTLERGYLMLALLLHHGSGMFTAKQLEDETQILAQRLSMLHGLNAPEYFHKPLFQQLVQVLLDLNYLKEDSHQYLLFDQALELLSQECRSLFDPALRHSIQQLTHYKQR